MLVNSTAEQLTNTLRGQVLLPGDAAYDEARTVWNGMIQRRPAMIARCTEASDVQAAVNFASAQKLPVTIKAGGHSVAGKAIYDDALVIDLSPMNTVQVDPEARTARVGPGATWRDFDGAAQVHGLATTGGVDSRTGVAGLTLGGGIGYLARKCGLSIDNLLAVGVVTAFEFQLHEIGPDVLVAQSFHPFTDARDILTFYRDFTAAAPNDLCCYALIMHVPPVAPFPAEFHGQIAIALAACYAGSIAEGEAALAPLQSLKKPIFSMCQPMPYVALQQSSDAVAPDGERYYWKTQFLNDLSDAAIDTIVARVEPLPGPFTIVGIERMGGAIAAVDADATAYRHRQAAYNFSVFAGWHAPEDDEPIISWTRQFHNAMTPHATGGAYLNYLDQDDSQQASRAYGANQARLAAIRQAWDPDHLFLK